MKKTFSFLLCLLLLLNLFIPLGGLASGALETRAIYVVFDNSGSMYGEGNVAWSQATYAMEVFASMLNFKNNDRMVVYPMHKVTVDGSQKASTETKVVVNNKGDIEKIHNMYTQAPGGTPYTPVGVAAADLQKLLETQSVDEGWLIILTDGEFDSQIPAAGVKSDLINIAKKHENLYVQFLAIGADVVAPDGDSSQKLYSESAKNTSEVVSKLAEISNRIFKRNSIEKYKSGNNLNFDISISKLIVFAQGENVSIKSLKSKEGTEVKLVDSYNTSYCTSGGSGLTSYITSPPPTDKSLKGVVATFENDSALSAGTYVLDVDGASQISVYYEPDVSFEIMLYDGEKQLQEGSTIPSGDYTVKVGFIDRFSKKFIEKSVLLGDASYEIEVNGQKYKISGPEGSPGVQKIQDVPSGSLQINANVTYLSNYSGHDSARYTVDKKASALEIRLDEPKKEYRLTKLEDTGPITAEIFLNGEKISKDVWDSMEIPSVKSRSKINIEIKKGTKTGTFVLSPHYYNGDSLATDVGELPFSVSAKIITAKETAEGKAEGSLNIYDNIRTLEMDFNIPSNVKLKSLEEPENAILMTVMRDGKALNEKDWQSVDISEVSSEARMEWEWERGEKVSTFIIHPKWQDNDMFETDSGEISFSVSLKGRLDNIDVAGTENAVLAVSDDKNLFDTIKRYWPQLLISLLVLVLILGYIPPFKKYLPKRLANSPTISCSPNAPGVVVQNARGSTDKSLFSKLIPYRAETGTIRYVPRGVGGVPKLQVRAAGGNGMFIANTKRFVGNENIKFDGMPVQEDRRKPLRISSGTNISVETRDMDYDCTLNQ